ncbi:MAG: class II fumarate hydratase [Desulfobacteraceae bacterium]|nr:MAG: class II fumarate hydratase [Desulfobacteraceae bacterium]
MPSHHTSETYREEQDSMGTVRVPASAYYGSQTQRAVDNFMRSGLKPPLSFIYALALIKRCAAQVNRKLGLLEERLAGAIVTAAGEVLDGRLDDQFVVDLFQTGSGTSTNMNMNEVLASRANEILTDRRGGRSPVHPNDHVNLGQSSNDVIPTALHIAAARTIHTSLVPALAHLQQALAEKAQAFRDIRKIGRTHLQDAVPMTLGQAFSGFTRQIELGRERVQAVLPRLTELALGGTAVGSGLNAHPEFATAVIAEISAQTHIDFSEARNHFEAQAARDAAVETSGALKTLAAGLVKIANDIRWLGSGPRCGIGEIRLPGLQPGSSIMPGKVNPVIPEAVVQVAYQVMGNDTAITLAGQAGNFELNVTLPLLAHNLLQSLDLLAGACRLLADRCIQGLQADREKCEQYIERSLALVTGLVPLIGYDRAAELAKKAYAENKTVRQVVMEEGSLTQEQIKQVLG